MEYITTLLNNIRLNFDIICDKRIYPILYSASVHYVRSYIISLLGLETLRDENVYRAYYYDGITKYCVVFPIKRGPTIFINVTDENNVNVTQNIIEFAGVGKNFHGIPTTPKMLGYNSLTFIDMDGESWTFSSDEIIFM